MTEELRDVRIRIISRLAEEMDYRKAVEECRSLIEQMPDWHDGPSFLAFLLLKRARQLEAEGDLTGAVMCSAESAELWVRATALRGLARLLRKIGDHPGAAAALVRAHELEPATTSTQEKLALADSLLKCGRSPEARELLEQVLDSPEKNSVFLYTARALLNSAGGQSAPSSAGGGRGAESFEDAAPEGSKLSHRDLITRLQISGWPEENSDLTRAELLAEYRDLCRTFGGELPLPSDEDDPEFFEHLRLCVTALQRRFGELMVSMTLDSV